MCCEAKITFLFLPCGEIDRERKRGREEEGGGRKRERKRGTTFTWLAPGLRKVLKSYVEKFLVLFFPEFKKQTF